MRHRSIRAVLGSIFALSLFGLSAQPAAAADPSPGDETITINVGDSHAGGDVNITFEKVFAGTTTDGTDVYIYVPLGALDYTGPNPDDPLAGVDPNWDPNPGDEFEPCGEQFAAGDYVITEEQVQLLGNQLVDQIVATNVAHFGPIGQAEEGDEASDAVVVLAYNILDTFAYVCGEDSFTAGFFAPGFIDEYGMNVIVIDTFDWQDRVGEDLNDYAGVIGHELEHLQHNYSDPGELSWVDEGLADMAIFLNGWGDTNDGHLLYHQVFHRETSLTRWGGGLENYGAAYSYFLYLWEQAGGNGGGDLEPDLQYDGTNGDRLIKLIFEEQADGMIGVQNAINTYNATLRDGETALRTAEDFFKDWAVAIWLDAEAEGTKFDFANINFGDAITSGWTIEIANELFFGGRGVYTGTMPPARWSNNKNVPAQTALPFGVSYETFRNPGPTFQLTFDGDDATVIAPHSGETHWYAGYQSQTESTLAVAAPEISGGETVDFWTWYFIEEGWDFAYVDARVDGEWVTLPLENDAGEVVTTNDDPHGNNTEGNGLTGTSGGQYFVDEPEYIHLTAEVPEGATDLRFRYSTDAAYLDTGWFIDDVMIDGVEATFGASDTWFATTGEQDNNWVVQIISACDLTPGVDSEGEIVDAAGFVYRFEGDLIEESGFDTSCMRGTKGRFAVVISNLPTGDLTVLDAGYDFTLTNTGNAGGAARANGKR